MVSHKVTSNFGYMGPGIIILLNQLTLFHVFVLLCALCFKGNILDFYFTSQQLVLTLVPLNKLRCHAYF